MIFLFFYFKKFIIFVTTPKKSLKPILILKLSFYEKLSTKTKNHPQGEFPSWVTIFLLKYFFIYVDLFKIITKI